MSLPSGAVARVEPSEPHQAFLEAATPAWAELKLNAVKTLVDRGETADSWAPDDTKIVTTSMIQDTDLKDFAVEEEVAVIDAFEPACHVAGDISVYPEEKPAIREESIKQSMKNAIYIQGESTAETTFLPILKGFNRFERELCYVALEQFPHNHLCFYAVTYFSSAGQQRTRFLNDLTAISNETDADIFAVGVLNRVLDEAPPILEAAAGQYNWRHQVNPGSGVDEIHAQRVWEEIEADVTDWLFPHPQRSSVPGP